MARNFEQYPKHHNDEFPDELKKKKVEGEARKDLFKLRGKMPMIKDPNAGKNDIEVEAESISTFDYIEGELSGNDDLTNAKRGLLVEVKTSDLSEEQKDKLAWEIFNSEDDERFAEVKNEFEEAKKKVDLAHEEFPENK